MLKLHTRARFNPAIAGIVMKLNLSRRQSFDGFNPAIAGIVIKLEELTKVLEKSFNPAIAGIVIEFLMQEYRTFSVF